MENYQHVISLGHFCAVATELDKLGLRDASLPFDWVISPLESVLYMIESHFDGFLEIDNLKREDKRKYIVKDKKYDIAFYHDYKPNLSIESQHSEVKSKYERRIKRFYEHIKEKTLFVRYIETKEEYDYLCNNYESVISLLKQYNDENELLLITKDIQEKSLPVFTIYTGKVPKRSSQKFARLNKELYETLSNLPYPEDKKRENLKRYKKALPNRIKNTFRKAFRKIIYS